MGRAGLACLFGDDLGKADMMIRLMLVFLSFASGASAHPGHLDTLAGHDHVSAGILIGIAIAIGLYGVLKGDKDTDGAEPAEEAEA